MLFSELSVSDAFEVIPEHHEDTRGVFLEHLRVDKLHGLIGHNFGVKQMNTSVSHRGVVRGIHFADVPPGQAKYVTVAQGSIIDFVIDIRVGSPTFGAWDSRLLDSTRRNALYISEGLGHAFVALEDNTVVTYLVSEVFNPSAEHAINPQDPEISLEFPTELQLNFSSKDASAPSLEELQKLGALPDFDEVQRFRSSLTGKG